jgi:hypothetical protein
MSIGWNFGKNTEKHLTSWKVTGKDPSTGDYTYKVDFHGLPQIFLRNDEKIIYRRKPWNNDISRNFEFSWNEHGINYRFSKENPSTFSRLVVNSVGKLQTLNYTQST